MNPVLPGTLAILLYLAGSTMQLAGIARVRMPARGTLRAIGLAAAVAHGWLVWRVIVTPEGMDLGLYHAAALLSLVMVLVPLIASLWRPAEPLFLVLFPLAALTLAAALALATPARASSALAEGLIVHIACSVLAYAVLTVAACQAALLAWQEHRLRSRAALGALQLLPPLQTMERFLFELLWLGIALLTLAIGTGAIFLEDMFEQRVVHHTVLSITSWVVFAVLLWGRHRLGWRGPTAIRWTLAGFVLLMLAYFGSKLVIEVILAD